ncbi:MAG: peptidoglycan DD-metalloendopeptidase family protein [Enhydrobacter sp.]|nr:peptidoglycan DD-metalloendopeptidase family protein [Enhydrobacter sp.]
MPTLYATAFRNPLGNGRNTARNDGDGFYVAFGFDEPNPAIGGSFHLGADWNGEGGGDTDLGAPVYAIANGTVVAAVSDQGGATSGFGNYVVLRHDLPEPTLINGQWVTKVHSLYAHLDAVSALSVGQQIGIGSQIGTVGKSGNAESAHLHLEITIGSTIPTADDGYNPAGAPAAWVDPVAFIAARTESSPLPPQVSEAEQRALDIRHAAMLANLAYNNSPSADAGQGWTLLSRSELGLTRTQWDNDTGDSVNSQFVFDIDNGQAIVARDGNRLCIAFRGTDTNELGDFIDDLVGGAYSFRSHYLLFSDLIVALQIYAEAEDITDVLVAGHSLGGAMVEYFMAEHSDAPSIGYSGVSFGSPGVRDIASNPGIDDRLLNIGHENSKHAGDPVYRATFSESVLGIDVPVDLPAEADLSLKDLLFNLGEHAGQLYNNTAIMLTWSLPLFSQFISSPAVYAVTITGNGDYTTGAANDYIIGGFDASLILAGLGDDLIFGNTGSDSLYGQNGSDWLDGGRGDDLLNGGGNKDFLAGGEGRDLLTGGSHADVFYFADGDFPALQSANPDRITDYNQGSGPYSAIEGDLLDIAAIRFATSAGFGNASTVRLRSVQASGGLPAGSILEINIGDDIWRGIARLDGIGSGESVWIALSQGQSEARTGSEFVVDAVGNGTTWSITPGTQKITEGNVTLAFTIGRSGTNLGAETVYVSTAQIHGSYNDGDYVGRLNVPVFFAAGDTSETFTVRINADAVPEGNESFGLIVQADPSDSVATFLASAKFTIGDGALPSVAGLTYKGSALDNIRSGTSSNDILFGREGNDTLRGLGGNDILLGEDGDDFLHGDAGVDVILTGAGWNYVDGGAGNDIIDARSERHAQGEVFGGTGDDTIYVGSGNAGNGSFLAVDGGSGNDLLIVEARAVPVNGSEAVIVHQFGNGVQLARYSSFDDIEAGIASGGDHLVSTGSYNYWPHPRSWVAVRDIERVEYRGQGGNDLFVSVGDEVRVALGGAGDDALYANWSATTAAIVWNVTAHNDAERTLGNGVVVQSIDRLLLRTGSGDDRLVLGGLDDHVETGAGNDTVDGGGGYDTLKGGEGNDTLAGGAGDDILIGGNGVDTASFANAPAGVTVNLQNRKAQNTGGAGTDTLSSIENLTGSAFGDTLAGDGGVNVLSGGAGADWLVGGAGGDSLIGGGGQDFVSYENAEAGVTASLANAAANTGDAAGDSYSSIEGLVGSRFDDVLTGDGGNNSLDGGRGADRLRGGGGLDTLTGGAGDDTFFFGDALAAGNVTTVADFTSRSDVLSLSLEIFGAAGQAGKLFAAAFHIGQAAHDAEDRIIYNAENGKLFYDSDGTGSGAAKTFAILSTGLPIRASDFTLV